MPETFGRTLIMLGALILAFGLVLTFANRVPFLGRLPGDLTFGGDRWTVYVPIATAIVLSVALTLALSLIGWVQKR